MDWREVLAKTPSIQYCKMGEAKARKGQFLGWRASDIEIRLGELADVINDHAQLGLLCRMPSMAFVAAAASFTEPEWGDPYYFLFKNVLMALMIHHRNENIGKKVDFIFDSQSKPGHEIERIFKMLVFTAPESIKDMSIIDGPPTFGDDKVAVPLQAADMLAWHARRGMIRPDEALPIGEKLFSGRVPIVGSTFTDAILRSVFDGAELIRSQIISLPASERAIQAAKIRDYFYNKLNNTQGGE